MSRQLVACMLNISEARKKEVVEKIAKAALSAVNPPKVKPISPDWAINATALNIFQDVDYNRSVITLVSSEDYIGPCVQAACEKAYELIDLSHHEGVHPRLGAVDLVPLHPISEGVSLPALGKVARGVAECLLQVVPGSSFFLFGASDPAGRGLVQRRKEVGWFRRPVTYHDLTHDLGPMPTERYGLTGVGAIPYMMNVNVTLDSADVALGRRVAKALRATTPGGLPGVQSMAFPHEGKVEVACNVDLLPANEAPADHSMKASLGGQYFYTPADQIEARVLKEAGGVGVVGTALVGFTPEEARRLALHALVHAHAEAWRDARKRRM
ncbi:glutamate formimidoyltransferase-like [Penaeus japonicus]|uniref:glutamate formimidoyltransferase-like n=1 Tax=Penaeus japonicus TaxID=27405 RepID=UPI001C7116CB|nr:glutamate formimidoyltransferase-like [Penaeus japonicus]